LAAASPGRPAGRATIVTAGRVDRDRATNGELGVRFLHVAARHDEELVDVGRAGHDRLRPRDHHAVGTALGDVDVGVGVRLLVRMQRAVALRVRHRHADGEILVLHLPQPSAEALVVLPADVRIDVERRLPRRVERIVRQVALRAAGLLTHEAHQLELREQVVRGTVDVEKPADGLAGRLLHRERQGRGIGAMRHVVRHRDRVDARGEQRLVRDAIDPTPVHVNHG